ncbi:MAG TPA: elongation factor P maturation arginine rhamnosyltransferase EarP, partial [Casimicrobiaceae bacterium]
PGFTPATGGLLREPGLRNAQKSFDRSAWLRDQSVALDPGERLVSLFCYDNPALGGLLDLLAVAPTLLLATPGAPAAQVSALLGPTLRRGALRAQLVPYVTQPAYDRLLWASDLNVVRGEDSFVRAQWAGKPFVWQIYPQQGDAHGVKLKAFLDRFLAGADRALAASLCSLWLGWNALAPLPAALPEFEPWRDFTQGWRRSLLAQVDLSTQLLGFARKTR